jgi:hypothetical protein
MLLSIVYMKEGIHVFLNVSSLFRNYAFHNEPISCNPVRTAPAYFERTKLRHFSLRNLVINATLIIQSSFVSGYENFQSNSSYGSINDPGSP